MTIINSTQQPAAKSSVILGNGSTKESETFTEFKNTEQSNAEYASSDLDTIYGQSNAQDSVLVNSPMPKKFMQGSTSHINQNADQLNVSNSILNLDINTNKSRGGEASTDSPNLNATKVTSLAAAFPSYINVPEQTLSQSGLSPTSQFQTSLATKSYGADTVSGLKQQNTSLQAVQALGARPASQLAQANQLQVQSVVSELSNIESTTATSNHSQALLNVKASQWGPIPVNTAAALPQQGQQLMGTLKDQVRFQIDQQVKHAEIRLDPPELGKLDLSVKLDGERLQIQLHAATSQVRDALQAGIERLRSDLALDHGGQIDVNISYGEQQPQQQHNDELQVITAAVEDEKSKETASILSELDVRA